jgi:hypothetical protein
VLTGVLRELHGRRLPKCRAQFQAISLQLLEPVISIWKTQIQMLIRSPFTVEGIRSAQLFTDLVYLLLSAVSNKTNKALIAEVFQIVTAALSESGLRGAARVIQQQRSEPEDLALLIDYEDEAESVLDETSFEGPHGIYIALSLLLSQLAALFPALRKLLPAPMAEFAPVFVQFYYCLILSEFGSQNIGRQGECFVDLGSPEMRSLCSNLLRYYCAKSDALSNNLLHSAVLFLSGIFSVSEYKAGPDPIYPKLLASLSAYGGVERFSVELLNILQVFYLHFVRYKPF